MAGDSIPIKYLGVPLTTDYIYASHCTFLLNKVFVKFKGWYANSKQNIKFKTNNIK